MFDERRKNPMSDYPDHDPETGARRVTRYIDARISLTWLIASVVAIVGSYAMLQARVSQLTETIAELKQDRAAWLAQNDRISADLRGMMSLDAVQNTRLANLEDAVRSIRREERK